MWERMDEEQKRPELKDPFLLVSLSTSVQQYKALYSHARELGKFMLKKMEFRRFATIYSSSMPPLVMISDEGLIRLSSASFYHHPGARDIVLLAGDSSPIDDQYAFSESVLKYAGDLGIREVVSVGTRWTEEAASPLATPKVKGFATDEDGVKELERLGVEITRDEPAPYFASLVVALAGRYGIRGYKLSVDHGEPIPHPRAVTEILKVLQRMMGFELDTTELGELAAKMAANLEAPAATDYGQRGVGGVYG
jgi:proteasome assembly chaperone (PAC2) family protein